VAEVALNGLGKSRRGGQGGVFGAEGFGNGGLGLVMTLARGTGFEVVAGNGRKFPLVVVCTVDSPTMEMTEHGGLPVRV